MPKDVDTDGILIVSEADCQRLVDRKTAFDAVESVFGAMARGDAYNFPVIREAIGYADALYGFKSGFDKAGLALGVKSGGFWPGNMAKGLTNHQSTVFLFNPDTGQLILTDNTGLDSIPNDRFVVNRPFALVIFFYLFVFLCLPASL